MSITNSLQSSISQCGAFDIIRCSHTTNAAIPAFWPWTYIIRYRPQPISASSPASEPRDHFPSSRNHCQPCQWEVDIFKNTTTLTTSEYRPTSWAVIFEESFELRLENYIRQHFTLHRFRQTVVEFIHGLVLYYINSSLQRLKTLPYRQKWHLSDSANSRTKRGRFPTPRLCYYFEIFVIANVILARIHCYASSS